MLNLEDAINKIEMASPDKYVSFVGKYKGNYLICAPRRDGSDLWTFILQVLRKMAIYGRIQFENIVRGTEARAFCASLHLQIHFF